jgi:hypothetical protein
MEEMMVRWWWWRWRPVTCSTSIAMRKKPAKVHRLAAHEYGRS